MGVEVYNVWSVVIGAIGAWISFVSLMVTGAAAIFAGVQLWQIKDNREKQYEQLRREKTVEIVTQYTQNHRKEIRATEKIVANLNDEECQSLYNRVPFVVDAKTGEQICDICPRKTECESGLLGHETVVYLDKKSKKIKNMKKKPVTRPCFSEDEKTFYVKDTILYFLRDNIITYLNSLECVLLAWRMGIVDRSVIEEQFIFLDKKRQKERALEVFRSFAGAGKSYPTIELFYLYLDQKKIKNAKNKLKKTLV